MHDDNQKTTVWYPTALPPAPSGTHQRHDPTERSWPLPPKLSVADQPTVIRALPTLEQRRAGGQRLNTPLLTYALARHAQRARRLRIAAMVLALLLPIGVAGWALSRTSHTPKPPTPTMASQHEPT